MAFAFNLGGDDIDLDEDDSHEPSQYYETQPSVQQSAPPVRTYFIGDEYPQDESTTPLLNSLPSTISYESIEIPHTIPYGPPISMILPTGGLSEQLQSATPILRRPTYDILLQLKAEADPEANQNAELISAMEDTDRQSGVYEGGLKTWEGALDLAALVKDIDFHQRTHNWHIVELGAGSAVPSMVALKNILAVTINTDLVPDKRRFHFTLSDYNDEVIRLSTLANFLLASKQELDRRQEPQVSSPPSSEGTLDVDEDLIHDCQQLWQQAGVSCNFVSGPWGKTFENAITTSSTARHKNVLILASETIYDLESLPTFTDTVINILCAHGEGSRAWIAAKKLYFGVGGGVDAFVQDVSAKGGCVREIMNTKQGVSRVVLEVTCNRQSVADEQLGSKAGTG